jgi:hypothetical protein
MLRCETLSIREGFPVEYGWTSETGWGVNRDKARFVKL